MASESTTQDKNIALMHRLVFEMQEKGNLDLIEELLHPDFRDNQLGGQPPGNRDEVFPLIRSVSEAFPDLKMEITQCICQGNVVATNKIFRGTLSAEFLGHPATGKMMEIRVMDFVTIEDGMIKDHWACTGPLVPVKPST